ncbi:NYN domain-containing protein [Lachnobacterium bovis]|uniref:NYN domain-containing protein n=1 Tax=Lachnobacterium bovis TaxID=140626 RepID=UPI000691E8CC|nr:NYN domain-containing protein [Lachnobacterium bovis]
MEKEYSKEFNIIFEEKDKIDHLSDENKVIEFDKIKKNVPEELQEINSHREIISKIAYLIGVKKMFFEYANQSPQLEIYDELDQNKNARIIRNLCILRTTIERNFKFIKDAMRYEFKTLNTINNKYISEAISKLREDDIDIVKYNKQKLAQYIIDINQLISSHIFYCKNLFPDWIVWDYIKDLFLMPNGYTEKGTKAAMELYYPNVNKYPYKMYINWKNPKDEGNILYNDKKFLELLYNMNGDVFKDVSRVSDISSESKLNIKEFIQSAKIVDAICDCENSDPYMLASVFNNMNADLTSKINKIILVDDQNTVKAWNIFDQLVTNIEIEHISTERVTKEKSLVDIVLTAETCKEHYVNHVDSFILISSDSDFWGLINTLPDVEFLIFAEKEKFGHNMREIVENANIHYSYIENFYSGEVDIRRRVLLMEFRKEIENSISFNVNDIFKKISNETRVNLSEKELEQFYDCYVKPLKITLSDNGKLELELGSQK